MLFEEKIRLLKAIRLLREIPERQLVSLAEFLRPKPLEDEAFVFDEGSMGMSLYFISSGRVRIAKRVADKAYKDLAIIGAGDFFGETALAVETPRSAAAIASGPCLLFELFRGDLSRWVKLNPQQAVGFFAELVNLQSRRLRRTSNELTLHFDLAELLGDKGVPASEFLARALDRVLSHLEGAWSGAVLLPGASGAFELSAAKGPCKFEETLKKLAGSGGTGGWLEDSTFDVALPGPQGPSAHLLFRPAAPLPKDDREETGRSLEGVAGLIAAGLRTDQAPG